MEKVKHDVQTADNDPVKSENLSYLSMVKNPAIRLAWLICLAANIIEGGIGTWGSKFLIDARSLDESSAAGLITMFFIGIAAGRFFCRASFQQSFRRGGD